MKPTLIRRNPSQSFSVLVNYLTTNLLDGDVRTANCQAVNFRDCVSEVAAHGTEAVTHLILSYRHGQMPTNEQAFSEADLACAHSGLTDLPRISAVHREGDNVHLHIAIATPAITS